MVSNIAESVRIPDLAPGMQRIEDEARNPGSMGAVVVPGGCFDSIREDNVERPGARRARCVPPGIGRSRGTDVAMSAFVLVYRFSRDGGFWRLR